MSNYRIRDLELLTGIKAHTIRMWEKRYGIFSPSRTTTNIRRYSDEDLRLALNISLLIKLGYRISQVARLPEDEMAALIKEHEHYAEAVSVPSAMVDATLHMDQALFTSKLNESIGNHGLDKAYESVIVPFLYKVGNLWQSGTITPAQEHFASNLIRDIIVEHTLRLPPPVYDSFQALLFLPDGEMHEIPLLYYNYIILALGYPTLYLGQSLPTPSIIDFDFKESPGLVLTSISKPMPRELSLNLFSSLANKFPDAILIATGYQARFSSGLFPSGVIRLESATQLASLIKGILIKNR